MDIDITGLRVTARHGVLEKEKISPQPFVLDLTLKGDFYAAAECDDLAQTVNYADVCALAAKVCGGNSFNLIEKLAYETAFAVAENFPAVKEITVNVHKPQAPVGLPFEDICARFSLRRERVVLSLGSNMGDREGYLNGALSALSELRGIKILEVSDFIVTQPYGGVAHGEFLNCAALAECLLPPRVLLDKIHAVEKDFGRVRKERRGDRTLDIDIVFYGDCVIEEEGLCIPHPDWYNRDFVLVPVKQIVPDFVCPLTHKRVSDF